MKKTYIFFFSVIQEILSVYDMPGTVLGPRNAEVIKTNTIILERTENKLASSEYYTENKTW